MSSDLPLCQNFMQRPSPRPDLVRFALSEPSEFKIDEQQLAGIIKRLAHVAAMDVAVKHSCFIVQFIEHLRHFDASANRSLHVWRLPIVSETSACALHHHESDHCLVHDGTL